tara:strand:- start:3554 stop:3931 length:378 start_codon:yes stop_codon:yes gene_type:complete
MAYTQAKIQIGSLSAASDLSAKQYHFVKLASETTVDIISANTDTPIGVLMNKPAAGEAAEICVLGIAKVKAHGSVTFGQVLGTTSAGKAEANPGATQKVMGQAIQDASANDVFTIFLNPTNCLNT